MNSLRRFTLRKCLVRCCLYTFPGLASLKTDSFHLKTSVGCFFFFFFENSSWPHFFWFESHAKHFFTLDTFDLETQEAVTLNMRADVSTNFCTNLPPHPHDIAETNRTLSYYKTKLLQCSWTNSDFASSRNSEPSASVAIPVFPYPPQAFDHVVEWRNNFNPSSEQDWCRSNTSCFDVSSILCAYIVQDAMLPSRSCQDSCVLCSWDPQAEKHCLYVAQSLFSRYHSWIVDVM